MASVSLVHPEATFAIPVRQVICKCSLFENNPSLTASPYRVQSSVSLSIFQSFISALEGNSIKITDTNFTGLQRLCEEFGFSEIAAQLSDFQPSTGLKATEDADTRGRIAALEEKAQQHDHDTEVLQDKLTQLSTDFERLVGEVSALRSAAAETQTLSALKTQIAEKLIGPVVEQLSTELSELRKEVLTLKTQTAEKPSDPVVEQLSTELSELRKEVSALWRFPALPKFDSRIISEFPEIFAEFRGKRFSLLWRGSRDGFKAKDFHGRCDGHANTLTVILDTKKNIFGGFTPLELESDKMEKFKTDESLKSFLFTLKNPHNFPAQRFALKPEEKGKAIICNFEYGPRFYGITVANNCNANTNSVTYVGLSYMNDSGLDGKVLFAGSFNFQVKEIEVFEITD
jgi:phosphopantetheinyl transferase (holo-ACP synthase)